MQMKTVKITKQPSVRQMCNMADNLRDHYKIACKIGIESFAYMRIPGKTLPKFTLYIADVIYYDNLVSWEDLQDKYLEYLEYVNINQEDADE